MDMDVHTRRERMLKMREELLAVGEDRISGREGVSPDELEDYLDAVMAEVEDGKYKNE